MLKQVRLVLLVNVAILIAAPAFTQQLSEDLSPLSYRLGLWTAAVEWMGPDGGVTRVVPSLLEVRPALDGHALESKGQLLGMPVEVRSIIFSDQESGVITEVGFMTPGRMDVLHATVEEDRVIFTAEPRTQGERTVIFRAIDSGIEHDKYETTGWISIDGGETWRQTFRQTNHRIDPDWLS